MATDGSAIGRDPLVALPFDKHYAKTANFIAIVNNLNPDLYQRNEQVLQSMKQSAPEAVKAL